MARLLGRPRRSRQGQGLNNYGSKGGGGKGPTGAINGSCWNCGAFGHRQSDCPALGANGHQPHGGKSKGGGKNPSKGSGKGYYPKGKGKGLNEFAWDNSWSEAGYDDWNVGQWSLAELAAEQARGSPPGGSSTPQQQQPQPQQASGSPWTFGVKALGALSRGPARCQNRFQALAEEEEEQCKDFAAEFPNLVPVPAAPVPDRVIGNCCPGCPLPAGRRKRRNWVRFDANAAEDFSRPTACNPAALRPLWKPGQGGGALCPLQREPECVVQGRRLKCIEAVVDSGAEETVAPRGWFPSKPRTSAMSRAGACYRTASGAPVPNLGEQDVQFLTNEGYSAEIPFQLADIERPLIAVSALAKAGNTVELTEDGGTITHRATGKVTGIQRRGGTYVLRMWVPVDDVQGPFPRPGTC